MEISGEGDVQCAHYEGAKDGCCKRCDKIQGDQSELENSEEENVRCAQYEEDKNRVISWKIRGEGNIQCAHYEGFKKDLRYRVAE